MVNSAVFRGPIGEAGIRPSWHDEAKRKKRDGPCGFVSEGNTMRQLYTKSLVLREFNESDAEAIYSNWAHDERVAQYCRWHPHKSIVASSKLLKMWLDEYEQGFEYRWAITQKGDDEPIGAIDVVDITDDGKTAEIGYVLSCDYWNRGYMTEALSIVISTLLHDGFDKIVAKHRIDNAASGKVMQKCGMQYAHDGKEQEKYGSDNLCKVKCYELIRP